MKQLVFILLLLPALISCQSGDKQPAGSPGATTLEWVDSTTQNLGKITEGSIAEVTYRFKNTGTKNLVIEEVRAGCGCTVAEKPLKPIAPGESEVIKAKFDSNGRPVGMNEKEVYVTANTTEKSYTLKFRVEITPKQ